MTRIEIRLPRAYRRLWWATGIDNLGNGVFAAAVPLLAVTVTRDPGSFRWSPPPRTCRGCCCPCPPARWPIGTTAPG